MRGRTSTTVCVEACSAHLPSRLTYGSCTQHKFHHRSQCCGTDGFQLSSVNAHHTVVVVSSKSSLSWAKFVNHGTRAVIIQRR